MTEEHNSQLSNSNKL